jgi:hypothetical protein
MLDVDEPHEVNAAAGRFAGALETVAGQVSETVANLVPSHPPKSALDHALYVHGDLMLAAFGPTIAANNGAARNTSDQTVSTMDAYAATDVAGRAHVLRYDTI